MSMVAAGAMIERGPRRSADSCYSSPCSSFFSSLPSLVQVYAASVLSQTNASDALGHTLYQGM